MKYRQLERILANMTVEELDKDVVIFIPSSGKRLNLDKSHCFYSSKNQLILNAKENTSEEKVVKHK